MTNLAQKFKIIIIFAVIILAGFWFAGTASAAYYTSGNWTSVNLLFGETVTSIDSFVYNLSVKPANTDATIQFSQDNTNWYNSAGVLDGTDTLTTGVDNTINLSGLVWSGANFYYKVVFTSDGTDTPVLDDISVVFTSNQPPNTPINSLPTNGATGQNLNAGLTGSAYSDPDSDPQTDADWQIDDDADFLTPVWTRTAGVAEATTTINATNGTFANELAGKTELDHNTTYYWKVKYNDGTVWSSYSTATSFTTNVITTPTNSLPTNGTTGQDLNTNLVASDFSDDQSGHSQADTSWQVDDDADFLTPVWTRTAGVAETSTTINSSNGTFANELAGKTELDHNTTYYWRVQYECSSNQWSDWSSATNFTTNIIHIPTNQSPAEGATVTTLSPLLTASAFSDDQSGHTHAASQWQVDDNSDFLSTAYDSGETALGEISHSVPAGYLANFSSYYWKVRYKGSCGGWTSWSTATSFSIQISATSVEVKPILSGNRFKPSENVPIEVQLLNFSDGTPLNNASTTVSIYNPSGTKVVNGATMTYVTASNGTYQYNYTAPSISGSYRYEVNASQDGDSGYGSASFYIIPLMLSKLAL